MNNKRLEAKFYSEVTRSYKDYDNLFSLVLLEFLTEQPDPLRRELLFYLGHTAAFTRSKLQQVGCDLEHHEFDVLFERGVSPDSIDDLDTFKRCDLEELNRYRVRFYHDVLQVICSGGLNDERIAFAIMMGIEHENLHHQTTFPHICKLDSMKKHRERMDLNSYEMERVELEFVEVGGGRVDSGAGQYNDSVDAFMWDNEQGLASEILEGFEVSKYPITNTQVVDFIRDGGYEDDGLWRGVFDFEGHLDRTRDRGMPFNFINVNGEYHYKTLTNQLELLPLAWPAMLNRYEANAISRYLGGSPIKEAQWHRIHTGKTYKTVRRNYLPDDVRVFGVHELGNVATWVDSDFVPICTEEEFVVTELYPDFSTEWFNQKHGLIKGTSFMGRGHMRESGFRDFMQNMMDYPASTYVVKESI